MICKCCQDCLKTSRLRPDPKTATTMEGGPECDTYYDEGGALHSHSTIVVISYWVCCHGHRLKHVVQARCPVDGCLKGQDYFEHLDA